jgi:hypothetical protein
MRPPGRRGRPGPGGRIGRLCAHRKVLRRQRKKAPNGGYARVPLRSQRGNLAGQLATFPRESLVCGNAAGSPRCGYRSHGLPPRTDWVAAMITPTTVAVVLGGGRCLAWWTGVLGPASVDAAPSA